MSTIEKDASASSELLALLREQEDELSELKERLSRWEQSCADAPEREILFSTVSGREIKPLYTLLDRTASQYEDTLGLPGDYPFTRGPYSTMYRTRLWTMRQFAGFGTAEETNERYKYLLRQGQTVRSGDLITS